MSVDILMGANAGAKTCGVTYGNGTRKELEQAGADYFIDSIDELTKLFTNIFFKNINNKYDYPQWYHRHQGLPFEGHKNAACGDGQFRVRRWSIPRAAMVNSACGVQHRPTRHFQPQCIMKQFSEQTALW